MSKIKRSIAALIIALTVFIHVHKPSDSELTDESPTETIIEVNDAVVTQEKAESKPVPVVEPIDKPKATGEDTAEVEVAKPIPAKETPANAVPPQPKPKLCEFEATFYTAQCEGCTGITASGHNVKQTEFYNGYRVLAADSSIPFGTKLRVTLADGTQFDGIVLDRGGAIRGKRLDILVDTKARAYELGRQQVRVEILN